MLSTSSNGSTRTIPPHAGKTCRVIDNYVEYAQSLIDDFYVADKAAVHRRFGRYAGHRHRRAGNRQPGVFQDRPLQNQVLADDRSRNTALPGSCSAPARTKSSSTSLTTAKTSSFSANDRRAMKHRFRIRSKPKSSNAGWRSSNIYPRVAKSRSNTVVTSLKTTIQTASRLNCEPILPISCTTWFKRWTRITSSCGPNADTLRNFPNGNVGMNCHRVRCIGHLQQLGRTAIQ